MTDIIAGVEVPDTKAVAEATRLVTEMVNPLLFHHSRRVFLLGSLHASRLGLQPDPELLYLAAMFHDAGLLTPFSEAPQRFEVDGGADHARRFLLAQGFSAQAADTVWAAVALHTTPEIPGRMGPEIAVTNLGVLTDVIGIGLDALSQDAVDEITTAHPPAATSRRGSSRPSTTGSGTGPTPPTAPSTPTFWNTSFRTSSAGAWSSESPTRPGWPVVEVGFRAADARSDSSALADAEQARVRGAHVRHRRLMASASAP